MKEAITLRPNENSFLFECPHCDTRIRRKRDKRTEKINFQTIVTCYGCKNRIILISPNKGPKISTGKKLCPKCKKNQMYGTTQVCRECFLKNPGKYKVHKLRVKNEDW